MIRKILIPLDLTSAEACRLGIRLARPFQAELIFVHCLRSHAVTSTFFFPKTRDDRENYHLSPGETRRAEEDILTFLSDLPLDNLRYSWKITKGVVLHEILKAVDSVRPDWIIQGSRIFSRLEEWVPRGTSWRLIQKSSCPVITVKHDPPPSRLPILSGEPPRVAPLSPAASAMSEPLSPHKILYITNFGESSRLALPHAAALANKTRAELIILHVLDDKRRIPGIRMNPPAADPAGRMELLLDQARALQTGLNASACLDNGNPEEAILSRIGKRDVDMIIMGTGNGSRPGMIQGNTLVERIFRRAACPVMTVNREEVSSGMERRYRKIFHRLTPEDLAQISEEQPEAIGENLFPSGSSFRTSELFLRHYSPAGLTRIFEKYGIFALLREKGFADLKITLNLDDPYRQRLRVCFAGMEDERHTLIELILHEGILEAPHLKGAPFRGHYFPVLMVEWLCMQNPTAAFTQEHPPLPGQQHPGLGISREILQLISLIGMRIGKDGIAIHPQYFHAALLYHRLFKCYNPVQEGQLAALMRDTEEFNLDDVSWAIDLGCLRGRLLRQKVSWEVDYQVHPLTAPLRQHFYSDHYRKLFWESLANHRYCIDWPQLKLSAASCGEYSILKRN
jgi:nucleotide-binding universal stress UspA family protein